MISDKKVQTIKLNTEKRYQVFESFGVSGAWWAQVVGGWNETDVDSGIPKREKIAELLFSKEKGIGVRTYRYNLGAGSAESGKGNIQNVSRRSESFDISDTEYDWSKDGNAVWMMKAAVRHGVDEVIFFVNSPPERLTINGISHCSRAFTTNLSKKNYRKFAVYCLDCVDHFKKEGIPVKYLSPVNEPVWKWTGGQEGCHYRPRNVHRLLKVFVEEMNRRPSLEGLKLSAAENGDIRWFNKTYCRILLKDKRIRSKIDAIDTHSYFLTPNIPVIKHLIDDRIAFLKRYRNYIDKNFPGVSLKTSEWTHMKGGRDYGMDSALEQTKVIMEDLSILNVTSWQLWIALSNVDYCDGLIYENDDSRTFELTKRYYAFGNFSKFIEKGSRRFEVDAGKNLQSVGFKKDKRLVVIISNRNDTAEEIQLSDNCIDIFITSEEYSLKRFNPEKSFVLPPKSVSTLIFQER